MSDILMKGTEPIGQVGNDLTYTDYTVTTDTNGYANLPNADMNTLNAMVMSPQRCGCDLWLNSVGATNYRVYVYSRGAYDAKIAETECVIRVWKKGN